MNVGTSQFTFLSTVCSTVCSGWHQRKHHHGNFGFQCLILALSMTTYILTRWGRVKHICVSKLAIIGADNGLLPSRRQAIIWTNTGILLIRPLGTNFSETFKIQNLLKTSCAKWRPFCVDLNVYYMTNKQAIGKCVDPVGYMWQGISSV